jgi:hypothetical protein
LLLPLLKKNIKFKVINENPMPSSWSIGDNKTDVLSEELHDYLKKIDFL